MVDSPAGLLADHGESTNHIFRRNNQVDVPLVKCYRIRLLSNLSKIKIWAVSFIKVLKEACGQNEGIGLYLGLGVGLAIALSVSVSIKYV